MDKPSSKPVLWRRDDSDRVQISNKKTGGWHATFTLRSYTVAMSGPVRLLREGTHCVSTRNWVRIYPEPFDGDIDYEWLNMAMHANQTGVADVPAIGLQYIAGSPPLYEDGLQVAGNADYGPPSRGSREEGSDFNDYLGVAWQYPDEPLDRPEARQFKCMDCSGFVRMVYGYRQSLPEAGASTVPLCLAPRADSGALPRRAHEMFANGPGLVLIENTGHRPGQLDALSPGDLLFFDADSKDGPRLDHVAIYLGLDTQGRRRFISSRKRANGPTMGDLGGRSILDGDGLYAKAFRAARRL